MSQNIMSIRIKQSGLLALPSELGQQYDLVDGETLELLHLGQGAFLLVRSSEKMTLEDVQKGFGQALAQEGYDTPDKIIELVRDIKRDMARGA